MLELVKIPDPAMCLKKYPHELSGGMRQRIMIAIALSGNPKILIADLGESGCGKTTCGRTCIGVYDKTDGQVLYRGKDVHKMNLQQRREFTKHVQMIFQDPYSSLDPRLKVHDIIAEGMRIHKIVHSKQEEIEEVQKLLSQVGLNVEHASRYVHEFSGGQRQRIGIARALAVNPEFLLCDEPISALDVSIQSQVVNMLEDMQEQMGLTYLFIAHDLSVVRFISDRIAVIHKGRIVELAEAEELFLHPFHPYTKALLSAVPIPDPELEKKKKLLVYDPSIHDYSTDKPVWEEILPGHFVWGNQRELEGYRKEIEG